MASNGAQKQVGGRETIASLTGEKGIYGGPIKGKPDSYGGVPSFTGREAMGQADGGHGDVSPGANFGGGDSLVKYPNPKRVTGSGSKEGKP